MQLREGRTLRQRLPATPEYKASVRKILRRAGLRLRRRVVQVGLHRRVLRVRLVGRPMWLRRMGRDRSELVQLPIGDGYRFPRYGSAIRSGDYRHQRSSSAAGSTSRGRTMTTAGRSTAPSALAEVRFHARTSHRLVLHCRATRAHNDHHHKAELLLLDSGADCCVYPRNYAPECPSEQLPVETTPSLVAVTGDPMQVRRAGG